MNWQQLVRINQAVGTPTFIYEEEVLLTNINRLEQSARECGLDSRIKIYLSYFANSNPNLIRLLPKHIGLTLQSFEEYSQLKAFSINRPFIVSPSFLSDAEIDRWIYLGATINLASLEEVAYFLTHHSERPLSFRLDLTPTGKQRTGIKRNQIKKLKEILRKSGVTPHSFHVYTGTESNLEGMKQSLDAVFKTFVQDFPEVQEINLGGGFAFNYRAATTEAKHFIWKEYFAYLSQRTKDLHIPRHIRFVLEPGRDIWTDAGSLLLTVKRVVHTSTRQISTDGSYVHLPSATIRKRQHRIQFFDGTGAKLPPENTQGYLSGSSTLSSDYIFPGEVRLPDTLDIDDLILISDVGSYGATQHMEFLNQRPCPEVIIRRSGSTELLTKRGTYEDKIRHALRTPEVI